MFGKAAEHLRRLSRCRSGATAIEYGLMASLIAAVIVAGVTATGTNVAAIYDKLATLIPT